MNYTKFPALLNVKMYSDNSKAGWFRRYVRYYPDEGVGNYFLFIT